MDLGRASCCTRVYLRVGGDFWGKRLRLWSTSLNVKDINHARGERVGTD